MKSEIVRKLRFFALLVCSCGANWKSYLVGLGSGFSFQASLPAQLVSLPAAPHLSPAGYQLILDYEVGGGEPYYNRFLVRPTWPGAFSGPTVGVGYDLGYNSPAVIRLDWKNLRARERLAAVAGVSGPHAKNRVAEISDILIQWKLAREVFDSTTLTRFYQLTRRTLPGFDDLRPNAQAALVSLVFNRGSSVAGPRRTEMRAIREAVPKGDYAQISHQILKMRRLWQGQGVDGLLSRREAEARLVETP